MYRFYPLKKSVAAIALALTLTPLLAFAGADSVVSDTESNSSRQKLSEGWFTGSLVASNATALPKGMWMVQPYIIGSMVNNRFDNNGDIRGISPNGSNTIGSITLIQYGVTDNFNIGVLPKFFYGVNNGPGSSSGPQLGDTTFRLAYMFHKYKEGDWMPTINLQVDQSFPTGDYENLSRYENGYGSGSYVTNISVNTQSYFWVNDRILRMRANGTYSVGTGVDIDNRTSYGTALGFRGKANPGDRMTVDIAFEYSLTQNWVPAIDFVYTHYDNTKVYGSGINANSGSAEEFSIAPAIEYNFDDWIGIIAGVQFTAAGRNVSLAITPQISVCMVF